MVAEVTKVLIVDDLPLVHKILGAIFNRDPSIHVVGNARNGKEAIDMAGKLQPQAIVMDIHMPVMDGLAATKYIMAYSPTPILILSSADIIDETNAAFNALKMGALEVMEKPKVTEDDTFHLMGSQFVEKIKLLARIKVIRHPFTAGEQMIENAKKKFSEPKHSAPMESSYKILVLGASTGGPGSILEILKNLPDSFSLPILIVQHMADGFTPGFVNWLNSQTSFTVKLAEDGEKIQSRWVYVAPEGRHLEISPSGRILLSKPLSNSLYTPSVDQLFESAALSFGKHCIGVLLTGMGADGAKGLLEIQERGGLTIAQDQASSAIYGMPRAAVEMGAVKEILPLLGIASYLKKIKV